jgi:ankyrin repeat protein
VLHHLSKIEPRFFRRASFKTALAERPDLEKKDGDGNFALHHAVVAGNEYVIRRLLKRHVAVDKKNYYGDTPLHLAARSGSTAIISILLDAGANTMQFNGSMELPGEITDALGYSKCSELLWKNSSRSPEKYVLSKPRSLPASNRTRNVHVVRSFGKRTPMRRCGHGTRSLFNWSNEFKIVETSRNTRCILES